MTGISIAAKREWNFIVEYYEKNNIELRKYPFGEYFITKIKNEEVLFYRCGARKVNCSGATQYMIDNFKLIKILLIGTCAGINKSLDTLDIIIPNKAVQYDTTVKEIEPLIKESFVINIDIPKNIASKHSEGTIGTADKAVVWWPDYLILSENNIDVADTESGAFAYICKLNNISCSIIKGISDFPHENNNNDTYNQQLETYINNTPIIMRNIIENYLEYFI